MTDTPADRIQKIIDHYAIAGANLLHWLTEDDHATIPRPHRPWWSLFKRHPSQREYEDWASDVACRATFNALREAKKAVEEMGI